MTTMQLRYDDVEQWSGNDDVSMARWCKLGFLVEVEKKCWGDTFVGDLSGISACKAGTNFYELSHLCRN